MSGGRFSSENRTWDLRFSSKPDISSSVAPRPFWCTDLREDLSSDKAEACGPPDLSGCKGCPRAAALRSWLRWLEAQLEEVRA